MLKNFLNKKTIIALLIIIAVILLIIKVLPSRNQKIAGEIYGKKITQKEFNQSLKKTILQAKFSYSTLYPQIEHFLDLETQTWEQILLLKEAKKHHIKASNKDVIKYIAKDPRFARGGKFNLTLYKSIVRQMLNVDTSFFESTIRDNLTLKMFFNNVTKNVSISDKELVQKYKNNADQMKVAYINVNFADFKKGISVSDAEILDYYNKNKKDLKIKPSVNTEFVLMKYPENAGVQKQVETKFKAKAFYKEFKEGKTAQELADKFGFKLQETGYYTRDDRNASDKVPYDILMQAFDLGLGQIAEPIEREEGYVIIINKDKRNAFIPELREVKNKIKAILVDKKAKIKAKEKADQIMQKFLAGFETGINIANFKKTAKEVGLEVKETSLVPKNMLVSVLGAKNENDSSPIFKINNPNKFLGPVEAFNGYLFLFSEDFKPYNPIKYQKEKAAFRENMLQQEKEKLFGEYIEDLKKTSGLKTYTFKDFSIKK